MSRILRVICSNIAEGTDGQRPEEQVIRELGSQFAAQRPDIVLLNEVITRRFGGNIQVRNLSSACGLPYTGWGNTVALGLSGWKSVAVLSKFPISDQSYFAPKERSGRTSAFGIFVCTINVFGVQIRVASLRFCPNNRPDPRDYEIENSNGHILLEELVASARGVVPLFIAGGDFNTSYTSPQFQRLITGSLQLARASGVNGNSEREIDHILYGANTDCVLTRILPQSSDHPMVVADLSIPESWPPNLNLSSVIGLLLNDS
jgi:endonuclease/exonuclease/phosphatase family metal-dependent hydrolase